MVKLYLELKVQCDADFHNLIGLLWPFGPRQAKKYNETF